MKKIALFELEEKEGVKIELHNDYLTFYDGDYTKVKYEDIISHKYLGMHDHIYSSFTRSLADLLHYAWDFEIEEIEGICSDYEARNENE